MRRSLAVILALCGAAACGGGHTKAGDTTPVDEGGGDDTSMGQDPCEGGMCSPETLEEIQHTLDRKRQTATRCLTKAIDDGEADKNSKGKITLDFVIGRDHKARDIKIDRTSIESQQFQDCIVEIVASITFPAIPKDMDWSYTYAFEAF